MGGLDAADGRPHVAPVLAVWLDGSLYFTANRSTRKARNLAHDPHCVVTAGRHTLDLVIEGKAARVDDDATLRRVADAYAADGGWQVAVRDGAFVGDGAPTAGPPPYDLYAVAPTTVFGFGADETIVSTRWRF